MAQFLRIQIYNSAGTEIEYDNKHDTDWGITTGTAKLESIIMLEELKYGTVNASMFEVQIFGLNIDLSKRKIRVRMEYDTIDDDSVIITDEDKKLITDSGKHFKFVHVRAKTLFTVTIQSAKKNNANSQRDIVAYDRLYDDKQVNIAPFWESFWSGHETATIAQFRTALLNYMGIDYVAKTLPNDSVQITNTFAYEVTELSFDTLLRMIGELQAFCPHINGVGKLEFIQLNDDAPLDITNNSEGERCYWEEYTTQTITGVAVYASSVELSQVVGNEGNLYNIAGNVLLLNMTGAEITTICNNLLTHLSTINYTPFYASLIISQPESNLGDKVITKYGDGYIMHSILSGPLLIDEYVDCKAQGPYLNTTATQINDRIIEANKRAVIEKTVDEFYSEYTDYTEDTTSTISQMSDRVVVKVDSNGNIGLAELGADPDTGVTHIQLNANSVDINSDTIQFNNEGYRVTGPIFTSNIQPDKHETICDYSEITDKSYFPHIDFSSTKAFEQLCSYVHLKSTATSQERIFGYNCFVISNFTFTSQFISGDFNDRVIPNRTVIGVHLTMSRTSYTQFISDGGRILDSGYLVLPSNKRYTDYLGTAYLSRLTEYTIGPGGPSMAIIAYLSPEDMIDPIEQGMWDIVEGTGAIVCVNPESTLT